MSDGKPTQYFLDKTESRVIQNIMKAHISDSELRQKKAKFRTFHTLNTLNEFSQVTNPFSSDQVKQEIKSRMKQQNVFIKEEPKNQLQVETETTIEDAESKAKQQIPEMQRALGANNYEYSLDKIQIKSRREATVLRGKMELRPMTFCIENNVNQEIDKTQEKYIKKDGLEMLDNRVPLLVVDRQRKEEEMRKNKGKKEQHELNNNSQVFLESTARIDEKQQQLLKQNEVATIRDALDFTSKDPILKTITKNLLKKTTFLNPVQPLYITGRCECQCHTEQQKTTEEFNQKPQKICLKCMCKKDEHEINQLEGQNAHNHNLLKNIPLPIYKSQQQSILSYEGKLTQNVIIDMIDQQFQNALPEERVELVAEQVGHLINRMWSPALRSDVSPGMNGQAFAEMLQQPSQLRYDQENFSLQGGHDLMVELQKQLGCILKDRNQVDANQVTINKEKQIELQNKQIKKLKRNIPKNELMQMRKQELNGVQKAISQSIIEDQSRPAGSVVWKNNQYYHEAQLEKIEEEDELRQQMMLQSSTHDNDNQIHLINRFLSQPRYPNSPELTKCIEKIQQIRQENPEYLLQTTDNASQNEENHQSEVRTKCVSPLKNKDKIHRQNIELQKRLQLTQSRVLEPSKQVKKYLQETDEHKQLERQRDKQMLYQYMQESNLTQKEMEEIMKRTQRKLIEIDKNASKQLKNPKTIDFTKLLKFKPK